MKLINVSSNAIIAEISGNKIYFASAMMEEDMALNGIAIPEYLQGDYNDQFLVLLDDPLFPKAFKEVYYKYRMNHEENKWLE